MVFRGDPPLSVLSCGNPPFSVETGQKFISVDLLARMRPGEGDDSFIEEGFIMAHPAADSRQPVALGFAAYLCAHVALFSLVGLLGLPMSALWWATAALIPSRMLMQWLELRSRNQLATLVGIHSCALAGGVLGLHGRELFCVVRALV